MDDIRSLGNTMMEYASRREAILATMVLGLLICFFGLKVLRALIAVCGFLSGAVAGAAVGAFTGVEGYAYAGVIIGCGLVFAVLSYFLYKAGVFCMTFIHGLIFSLTLARSEALPTVAVIVLIVVFLGIALLAVKYVEPVVIIVTAITGGIYVGDQLAVFIPLPGPVWVKYAIGGVLAVAGIAVQFSMHSKKLKKKEMGHAEEIREHDSMESEIEKARNILDEDDEEE